MSIRQRYGLWMIVFGALIFAVSLSISPVFAVQNECYGFAASTRATSLSTQNKLAQQWTPVQDISVTGIAFNIYGQVGDAGNFMMQVQETVAGLPDGVTIAGTLVSKAAATVPPGSVGVTQAFDCDDIPNQQIFNFAAPVTFTGGTMYALIIYHTLPGMFPSDAGWRGNDEGVAPLQGLVCTGAPCITDTGWAVADFGGDNYDQVYAIYDEFVDPFGQGDKKIDDHIFELRDYMRLGGDSGGLIFGLGVMAIIFAVGVKFGMPFQIVALFNAILLGAFARAGIMPAWILMAGIAIAGFALIFQLTNAAGNISGDQNEE